MSGDELREHIGTDDSEVMNVEVPLSLAAAPQAVSLGRSKHIYIIDIYLADQNLNSVEKESPKLALDGDLQTSEMNATTKPLPTTAVADESRMHSSPAPFDHTKPIPQNFKEPSSPIPAVTVVRSPKHEMTREELVKRLKQEKEEEIRKNKDLNRRYQEALRVHHKTVDELTSLQLQHSGRNRQFKILQNEHSNLVKKYSALESTKNQLQNQFTRLSNAHEPLVKKCSALENEKRQLQSQYTRLNSAHEPLLKRCSALDKDNDELRSQIANAGSAQEPLREENYYILQFNQINIDIESWAAKESRTVPTDLSGEHLSNIASWVKELGNLSSIAEETLNTLLLRFQEDRRIRIALTRYIVGVILFNIILDRFTFGLPRESSDYFMEIEREIYNQGSSFRESHFNLRS
jgi:DNA repair exonuclease SbcCD ATPase subunit